jgi:hypothetical protein
MPKIEKTKKIKKSLKSPKKIKSTSGYYLCMGDNCHGQNIAQVAKDCKTNAPSLTAKRVKKFKELAQAAKVIGKFANDLERVLPR